MKGSRRRRAQRVAGGDGPRARGPLFEGRSSSGRHGQRHPASTSSPQRDEAAAEGGRRRARSSSNRVGTGDHRLWWSCAREGDGATREPKPGTNPAQPGRCRDAARPPPCERSRRGRDGDGASTVISRPGAGQQLVGEMRARAPAGAGPQLEGSPAPNPRTVGGSGGRQPRRPCRQAPSRSTSRPPCRPGAAADPRG